VNELILRVGEIIVNIDKSILLLDGTWLLVRYKITSDK